MMTVLLGTHLERLGMRLEKEKNALENVLSQFLFSNTSTGNSVGIVLVVAVLLIAHRKEFLDTSSLHSTTPKIIIE